MLFNGLSDGQELNKIPLNETFKLVKNINSTPIEIGYLQCSRLLAERTDDQFYLASLLNVDAKKIHILECFVENVRISFQELEGSYATSWLSACCIFHFTFGHLGHFSNEVKIDVTSLKCIEDFYCYLGEVFFGYAGYAGQDLDGCYEILKSQKTDSKISLSILDEEKTKRFLAEASGQQDYYERFITMITDLDGVVTFV